MRILHYSLGLPPYRSGGLTKYSCDLMKEQVRQGDIVYMLFPGKMGFINKITSVKWNKKFYGIIVYELINPLPVPLLNGIGSPINFMKQCNKEIFISFLKKVNVEIVHIHTFMGLYKEFLDACKELNIRIVYTTHDYFGLCTKVNFIDFNGKLCEKRDIEKCIVCNNSAYSLNTIRILQSRQYRFAKKIGLIEKAKKTRFILKKKNDNIVCENLSNNKITTTINKEEYTGLLEYYNTLYSLIDIFLYNSKLTMDIYNDYIESKGEIVTITHSDIKDNRKIKSFSNEKLRLTYLGPFKEYKGFNILISIMKEFEKENYKNIELNAYGDNGKLEFESRNINLNGKYLYNDLQQIFDKTDVLVVPSIWNETFGFITLEALSYGVPVLITEKVGSKELVYKNNKSKGIITSASKDALKAEILKLYENRKLLNEFNSNIINDDFNELIEKHYYNLKKIYNMVTEDN